VRIGRYGASIEVEREEGSAKASIPKDLTPSDLDPEQVETLLRQKTEGPEKIGLHPETGEPIYALIGAYGPYVQLGDVSDDNPKPKRASLPKGGTTENVTLEAAVGLLSLPRLLGNHPETGGKLQAGLGRFGPYIVYDQGKDGKDYRSLKAGDDVLTVDLERALALIAEPKGGRGKRAAAKPIRELGAHPADGEPVNIYDGPYGPYIKHGKVNASLPEGQTVEAIAMDIAIEALNAKAGTKKGTKKPARSSKATGGKSTTRKTATKTTKSSAAKSTTAKSTATKSEAKSTATKSKAKSTATKSTALKPEVEESLPEASTDATAKVAATKRAGTAKTAAKRTTTKRTTATA